MFRRLRAAVLGIVLLLPVLVALPSAAQPPAQVLAQTLTWTADDEITRYTSAPATAVAGATTVVFQNNAVNMPHTVTFDTSTPGYNHDVNLNIFSAPGETQQAQVTLTPGRYRYYCAVPGHTMAGEFTVTPGEPDTTPPTVTAEVTGDQDSNGNYLGTATVTLAATDTGSGVNRIEYSLDGGAFVQYTAPVVVNAVGSHMIHYRATDNAGNTSPEQMRSFTVVARPDTTPPTVTAVVTGDREPDGDYIGSATVTITATDTESGVATVEYELDDTGFQPYTAPVVVTAVGDHSVQYRATDRAGNVSPVGSTQFRVVEPTPIDTTPPTVSAVVTGDREPDGDYIGSALVTLSATDTESGVDRIEYSLDGAPFVRYTEPVLVNSLGAHMVHYRATDRAGNTSPEGMQSFTIVAPPVEDTTPPATDAQVTGDREPDGDYIGRATVTITATDAESGVDRIEYAVDGGGFVRYTAPVVFDVLGQHTVRYRATDVAGNTAAEKSVTFTIVAPPDEDTTPPATAATVSGNRDPNGNYIDTATVTITATDSQSGVDTIEYAVDGGAWTEYTGPVRVDAAGDHTVLYRATDIAGNTSPAGSVTFRIVEPGPDACPSSDTRTTVIIDDYDTHVSNVDTGDGCTINDLIDEDGEYPDHASFVRHVDHVTARLVGNGILTPRDQGSIVRAAARSDIGN